MATAKIAETAQELRDKYKSKRYKADNAGLAILIEYLYRCYLLQDNRPANLPESLYSQERYEAIIAKGVSSENARDRWLVNGMQSFMEWIPTANDAASTARAAAIMAIDNAISSLNVFTYALTKTYKRLYRTDPETLLERANNTAVTEDLADFEHEVRKQYELAREYIENNLCYLHAYNAFIDIIRDELAIPEIQFFQVEIEPIEKNLERLNEALQRQHAAMASIDDECENITNFRPVSLIPEEIPEENIRRSTGSIVWAIYHGGAWSNAFMDMIDGYWRRIANG